MSVTTTLGDIFSSCRGSFLLLKDDPLTSFITQSNLREYSFLVEIILTKFVVNEAASLLMS